MNPDPTPQLPPVLPGFNLNKYIEENRGRTDSEWLIPRIECADGFSLSVQASRYNYSSPRDNSGPYYQAEVGFPSAKEESLMEYCDNSDKPTETVYGYVPVEIIEKIVDSHGGIALANGIGGEEPTFEGINYGDVIPAEPSADHRVSDWSAIETYLLNLKEGERVVECGVCATTGHKGTIKVKGDRLVVEWDAVKGGVMTTSLTGGTRRISDVIQPTSDPCESVVKESLTPEAKPEADYVPEIISQSAPAMKTIREELEKLTPDECQKYLDLALSHKAKPEAEQIFTCPASRHVAMMAEELDEHGRYVMFEEDPKHCAGSMRATVGALWKAREELSQANAANRDYLVRVAKDAHHIAQLEQDLAAARATIKSLRAALEPFAKEAPEWKIYEDGEQLVESFPQVDSQIRVGDLRRALAALAPASPNLTPAPDGWRPIETVPIAKEVLLHTPFEVGGASSLCCIGMIVKGNHEHGCTHWMPLPEAPASSGKGEG